LSAAFDQDRRSRFGTPFPRHVDVIRVDVKAETTAPGAHGSDARGPGSGKRVQNGIAGERNMRISLSASSTGNGAGCPRRVDSPLMSVHAERVHRFISSGSTLTKHAAASSLTCTPLPSSKENGFKVVLNDRARLVWLSVKPRAVSLRLGYTVGDLEPNIEVKLSKPRFLLRT